MLKRYGIQALAITSVCLFSTVAFAQEEPEPEDDESVELGDEGIADDDYDFGSSDSPSGADENPDAPGSLYGSEESKEKQVVVESDDRHYPIELIYRPINLLEGMSEVSFAIPTFVDPFDAGLSIRANYGITDEVQIGLRYGVGNLNEEDFAVGKALSVDAQYAVTDWMSAQLSLPMYLDPFAMGLTLGVPMRFEFFDSFALLFGRDLVSFTLVDFLPNVNSATENEANVAKVDINELTPDGEINMTLGAFYQFDDNFALDANFGTRAVDFTTDDAPVLLNAALVYSTSNMFDLGARVGSDRLDDALETFSVNLFMNLRI